MKCLKNNDRLDSSLATVVLNNKAKTIGLSLELNRYEYIKIKRSFDSSIS